MGKPWVPACGDGRDDHSGDAGQYGGIVDTCCIEGTPRKVATEIGDNLVLFTSVLLPVVLSMDTSFHLEKFLFSCYDDFVTLKPSICCFYF